MAESDFVEVIRRRAYQIWEGAGRPNGFDIDHWLQAEAEYRSQPVHPNEAPSRSEPPPPAKRPRPKAKRTAKT